MDFDQLVIGLLNESKDYYGKKIPFVDPETGKSYKEATIVDPEEVERISTEHCYGAHIADEWHGACINKAGRNFNTDKPPYYIVATGDWKTNPKQGDFHIIGARGVEREVLKQSLSPDTKESFNGLIDILS